MTENIRSIPKALDGGWGWVVCGCSFLVNCILGGLMYSFGIMYVEFLDYFGTSKSRTSLTLSILQGIANGTGPLNAFLINRFGCRLVGSLGAVLQFCGYVISSWGTNLTYLYVSFGVLGGLGNGMIYISMLVAITQYFDKRRAIATGISVSGVGIGTFILGPLTKWLVDEYTWKGAMLIQGGITLNCLVCCLVYMPIEKADRLYHSDKAEAMKMISGEEVVGNRVSNVSAKVQVCVELEAAKKEISSEIMDSEKLDESCCTQENANLHEHTTTKDFNAYQKSKYCNAGGSVQCNDDRNPYVNECDLSAHRSLLKTRCVSKSTDKTVITFKDQFLQYVRLLSKLPFVLVLIAITSTFLGQIIPYMYIVDTMRLTGVGPGTSSWLVAALGISDTLGRALYGLIANNVHWDVAHLFIVSQLVCGAVSVIFPLVKMFGVMVPLCVVFGFVSGGSCTLTMVLLIDTVDSRWKAEAFGMYCLSCGVALFFGYPVAGWLYDTTRSYVATYVFAGVTMVLSGGLVFVSNRLRRK